MSPSEGFRFEWLSARSGGQMIKIRLFEMTMAPCHPILLSNPVIYQTDSERGWGVECGMWEKHILYSLFPFYNSNVPNVEGRHLKIDRKVWRDTRGQESPIIPPRLKRRLT